MTSSVIGIDTQTGQRVEVPQASRRQGTYIIGANGTGKTGLIENLILQDIQQGLGVCLLDPHGDLTLAVLSRIPDTREKDVIYLDIADEDYPFGVNLFACDNLSSIKAVQYVVDQVMHIFDKLFDVDRSTPLLAEYLRNCTHTLVVNPGFTMADIPFLLLDEHCRRKLVAQVTDPDVRLFWRGYDQMKASEQREEAASTLRRVREFLQPLTRNIVGQSTSTLDFRRVMDERKILLVKLDARLPSVTSLIGSVIVAEFLNAAFSRSDVDVKKRKQFNIYADEFQRFATEDFATFLTEARKFGIAITIAHQMRDQLDPQNKGATLNVANVVVFKISGKDAEELAGEFDSTPPPPEVIGQRPILSPKRDVIDHLVSNGHSNPGYLDGTKLLSGLLQVSGERIDSPQYEGMLGGGLEDLLANMMIGSKNKAAQNQYLQATQLLTELKAVIQRFNNFFYEVMRDRNANKPLDQKDLMILLKVMDLYAFVSRFPNIIGSLCSADLGTIHSALGHMQKDAQEGSGISLISPPFFLTKQQRLEKVGQIAKVVLGLRKLMDILAREPIMVDSGQHEPIYDKPRTYADVQNEIATRLANLPKFTARVKITVDGKPVEYTVKTLSPERGIRGIALQGSIDRIRANNRTDGYTRTRDEVEEEIRSRQNPPQAPPDTPLGRGQP